jgi:NADP-dependent 3-hydroxy acid dehydrogenase YdfG
MRDVRGKVAVVTGAAGGIGGALTARFVAEGASVVMADLDADNLKAAADAVRANGGDVEPVVTDITDPGSVMALADAAYARFDAVDIVCANVGIMGRDLAPVWEAEVSDWQHVFAINTFGVVHTVDAFLPRMLESGRAGHIVITSSMAGVTSGSITSAPYLASKHASRAIAETLRRNLAERQSAVNVSVLCPGPVNTGMLTHVRAAFPAFDSAHAAVGGEGVLEPAEVADKVLDAIRSNRFFIFTHADSRRRVTDWFESILQELPA